MDIGLVTLFPDMFKALATGITGRAQEQGLMTVNYYNPRDFTEDNYKRVDDRPYGGGPGMVMMALPIKQAITKAKSELGANTSVIFLTPEGAKFNHQMAATLAKCQQFILLCGRYEGIDQRLIDAEVDQSVSIGDFVLSGGELAAMVVIDAVTRLLPNALGHEQSAIEDSFVNGLLDYPHYTRPEVVDGVAVPAILQSGDHAKIARWRMKQALGRTWLLRRDLLDMNKLDLQQRQLLTEFIDEYGDNHEYYS